MPQYLNAKVECADCGQVFDCTVVDTTEYDGQEALIVIAPSHECDRHEAKRMVPYPKNKCPKCNSEKITHSGYISPKHTCDECGFVWYAH